MVRTERRMVHCMAHSPESVLIVSCKRGIGPSSWQSKCYAGDPDAVFQAPDCLGGHLS